MNTLPLNTPPPNAPPPSPERPGERTRRMIVGLAVPALGLVVAAAVVAVTDVPDPLATHWSLGGDPDDSMARSTFLITGFVLIALGGLAAFAASRRAAVGRGDLVGPVAMATFLQWIFVGVAAATLVANTGRTTWADARSLPVWLALLIPLGAAMVAAVVGRLVLSIGEPSDAERTARPTVGKGPTERLAWLRQVNATWPVALGGGIAAIGSVFLVGVAVTPGIVLLLVGAMVAMFATVRVAADRRGLTVTYGPLGWPRTTIGLDRIRHAEMIDVRPAKHGGWGYRGSIRVFGRAAVVVRAGEGIQLDLVDGKRFVVTVDDAAAGAGTINDLLGPAQA